LNNEQKETVVLTGAGISAESGLKTFRDSDGLWEGYNIEDVATPRAWRKILNWFWNFIITAEKMYWMHNPMQRIVV
jgi:NAD-dependent SIR2 family protein deacetylase